ncbi:MAG TPA: prolipoprotein diacylglyceryl transferase family protein [Gemmatimonadaceae bacterium]|nr:prolipoprotein diacylglyceryl transferase family protein [Gemmatimonadaceae bacterium]
MTFAHPIIHHPFQFSVLGFAFTGFGIAVLLAFLMSQIICERELARRGHPADAAAVSDVLFAAVVGTLIGAKLYYVIVITHRIADFFSRGGFVFWGGFVGAVVACGLTIWLKKRPFWRFADVAGIAIASGYSIGRTGCWAVGDDYGKPWTGPLAVAFPNGAPPSTVADMAASFRMHFPPGTDPNALLSVYPTQILEVALGFVMFFILWKLRDHRHREGWLFGIWCVLAGAERFCVEFLRVKDDRFPTLGGLSMAQAIAIGVVLVGLTIAARFAGPRSNAMPATG